MQYSISNHAIQRYIQRIDQHATPHQATTQLINQLKTSRRMRKEEIQLQNTLHKGYHKPKPNATHHHNPTTNLIIITTTTKPNETKILTCYQAHTINNTITEQEAQTLCTLTTPIYYQNTRVSCTHNTTNPNHPTYKLINYTTDKNPPRNILTLNKHHFTIGPHKHKLTTIHHNPPKTVHQCQSADNPHLNP